jgi:uncharacterized iron-regulated membrane protein
MTWPWRASMSWLHTWAGLAFGSVLFAIFWTGTLSVFDEEIDRWMMPATRLSMPADPLPIDHIIRPAIDRLAPATPHWFVRAATARAPILELNYAKPQGGRETVYLDPSTGATLPDPGTWGGTQFIYPFHIHLQIHWRDLGTWIVGLASMAMLALIVSGVIIHRRFFTGFFSLRPERPLRLRYDLHTLSGVVALPFHIIITLSGLIIFGATYLPSAQSSAYHGDRRAQAAEGGGFSRAKAGRPAPTTSLDAIVDAANHDRPQQPATIVQVWNQGDVNAYISVGREERQRIQRGGPISYYDGVTGALLRQSAAPLTVTRVRQFVTGLHVALFDHWTLRWMYFLGGLAGCVLIATGFLFWIESRRTTHLKDGLIGVIIVEAVSIGSVTGVLLGTLAFFLANRLLPVTVQIDGVARPALEVWAFFLVWAAAFVHAGFRGGAAWREQAWTVAIASVLVPITNWLTTGDHPVRAIGRGQWAVVGMDAMLLISAAIAALAAWRLGQLRVAARSPQALAPPPETAHA